MGFVQEVIPERVGHESLSPGVTDGKSQEEKPKVGPFLNWRGTAEPCD